MCRYLLLFFTLYPLVCISQQKILLVGTFHRTERDRLKEILPVAAAVENFHPGAICVEYPIPTDTASVINRAIMHQNDAQIFQKMEALRKEWKVPADMATRIELLQQDPELSSNLSKRMELQQLLYLSSDLGNADYQGYLIMSQIKNNPDAMASLREDFPGFKAMMATFEYKCYVNDEYCRLVFPLAARFEIPYLYPIDDQSQWKESQEPYLRLQVRDTVNVDKKKYHNRSKALLQALQSLPKDSNQWIFSNSPQFTQDLLYAVGYKIDPDITNEDVKLLHHYWVQRNKIMAQHIDAVANKHPNVDIVVFFGAGHVGSVLEELNKLHKRYHVLTLSDVIK